MYDSPETVNKGLKKLMLLINEFFTLLNVTINFFPCELGLTVEIMSKSPASRHDVYMYLGYYNLQ